ncbi:hypothetical protein [Pyrobaculum sp.]|uniref:hypothetical protein n=1 Tax=Pyrobaculum sp. TaxID=2004705 RepID=UPI003D114D96
MAWEAIEVATVAGVLLGFVLFVYSYLFPFYGPTQYKPSDQPQLVNAAQQALDRVVFINSPTAARSGSGWSIVDLALSAPAPLYQPQIDVSKLASLQQGASGAACYIQQKALVDATGISSAVLTGYGVLKPAAPSASFDYVRILKNFFGGDWDRYDFTLVISPLVNLTVCPNVVVQTPAGDVAIYRKDPMCQGVGQGVWVRSTAGGRVVATAIRCEVGAGCALSSYDLRLSRSGQWWEAQIPMPVTMFNGLGDTAGLVVIAQKVDYPRAMDYYVFNTTSRSLVYGMYGTDGMLWFMHDATVSCGSGNIPALGIRSVDVFTGAGFQNLASDVTLDPGVGVGAVKVDYCGSCTSNSRCAACWVEPPPGALFAVVWAERNSQGGSAPRSVIVVVPLMPTPPQAVIRIDTWLRWTPNEPRLQSAVATRVVESQSATYLLKLVLYRRP